MSNAHGRCGGEDSESRTNTDANANAIAEVLDAWVRQLGRQFGPLSRPQRRMLRLLRAGAVERVGDLAEQLDLTTAGATRMLNTLEALNYARRFRVQGEDQRQVRVEMTPEGRQALLASDAAFTAQVERTLAPLASAERARLLALLRAIVGDTEA